MHTHIPVLEDLNVVFSTPKTMGRRRTVHTELILTDISMGHVMTLDAKIPPTAKLVKDCSITFQFERARLCDLLLDLASEKVSDYEDNLSDERVEELDDAKMYNADLCWQSDRLNWVIQLISEPNEDRDVVEFIKHVMCLARLAIYHQPADPRLVLEVPHFIMVPNTWLPGYEYESLYDSNGDCIFDGDHVRYESNIYVADLDMSNPVWTLKNIGSDPADDDYVEILDSRMAKECTIVDHKLI